MERFTLDRTGGIYMKIFNILKQLATPRRLHNWFNPNATDTNRPTTANISSDNYGGIRKFLATNSMPNRPDGDGHIIHLDWDNAGIWSSQLFIPNGVGNPKFREQLNSSDWSGSTPWYAFLSEKNTADWVIEQGTSSIWTWEKWNSGKSVCWGTLDIEVTAWNAWGSLYEGTPAPDPTYFPPNLFIAVPVCHANISIANTSGGVISCEMGRVTNERIDYIVPIRPTTTGVPIQYKAFILAIGNWK